MGDVVQQLTDGLANEQGTSSDKVGKEMIGLDQSSAHRRLKRAERLGFVVNEPTSG